MNTQNSGHLQRLFSLLEKSPGDSFLLYAIALEYQKTDLEKSLEYFKKLLELHPGYTATYYHLGKLYELLGQNENAVKTYETGLEVTKQAGDTHAYSELQGALTLIGE